MTILDITDWREKNMKLKEAINLAVMTYSNGITPLPDVLKMNQQQFMMLNPDMLRNDKDRLYLTPHNVMEVLVV